MNAPANGAAGTGGRNRTLWPGYLAIAIGPVAVFLLSQEVLQAFEPLNDLPTRIAEFDMHKEGAARLGTLAALFLFIASAAGAIIFFFYTALMLQRRSFWQVVGAFLLLAVLSVFVQGLTGRYDPQDHLGQSLGCLAAGYDDTQSRAAREAERRALEKARRTADPGRTAGQATEVTLAAGVAREHLPAVSCADGRFGGIANLLRWQGLVMVLAISGLVFGAICCLAKPADSATADMPKHWQEQSNWLNTYLYLSALLLACGLIFINAFLLWPSYVLLQADAFNAHAAALVAYYGFTYTAMLASFYIPVATILTRKVKALVSSDEQGSTLPDAFKGPLQVLKIVFALFSTMIASVFTGLLGLAV